MRIVTGMFNEILITAEPIITNKLLSLLIN